MVMNKKDKRTLYLQLVASIVAIIIGIFFIFRDQMMWWLITIIMQCALAIMGLLGFVDGVRRRRITSALYGFGAIIAAVSLHLHSNFYLGLLELIFGFWALFNAGVHSLELYVKIKDGETGKIGKFISILLSLIFAIILLFSGKNSRFIINLQIGSYVIALGVVSFLSAFRLLFSDKLRLSFSLPVALAALIPNFLIKNLSKIKLDNPEQFSETATPTTGQFLSIYLYTKEDGPERIGHLDIGFKGAIYSYGAHDSFDRAKTMAFGAGVMIVGSEVDFVQYAVDTDTTVFRFVLKLTETQSESIQARIDEILQDAYYYDYPYQDDIEGVNYLSRLRHANLKLDFYKFHKGKFKTYNVFTTNCVLVADQIVQATGMRLLGLSGIATPGAYYEYLESQRNQPGTIVMMKRIYTKDKRTNITDNNE